MMQNKGHYAIQGHSTPSLLIQSKGRIPLPMCK